MEIDQKIKTQIAAEAMAKGYRLGYIAGVEDGKVLGTGFQVEGIGFASPSAHSSSPTKSLTRDGYLTPNGIGGYKTKSN